MEENDLYYDPYIGKNQKNIKTTIKINEGFYY